MEQIEAIFDAILRGDATAGQFAELAEALETRPAVVLDCFGELHDNKQRQSLLRACASRPGIGRALLALWLAQADAISTPALQRELGELAARASAEGAALWRGRAARADERLAVAMVAMAEEEEARTRAAQGLARLGVGGEELERLRGAVAELSQLQQRLTAQGGRRQDLRRECDELKRQIAQAEAEVRKLEDERTQLRYEYESQRAPIERELHKQIAALRTRLGALVDLGQHLKDYTRNTVHPAHAALRTELEELERLIIRGELNERINRVYDTFAEYSGAGDR